MCPSQHYLVRDLGLKEYAEVWAEMRAFTDRRTVDSADEIWLVEHLPVYTQGQAGKAEHLFNPGEIPVVASDRGGQVTYHGPGQLVAYPLLDLKRLKIGVRELVTRLENSVIDFLAAYDTQSAPKAEAPGVYVKGKKIASLGLRVRRSCSYHGLAVNIQMDLSPFSNINPCGYEGLQMTQLCEHTEKRVSVASVREQFLHCLIRNLFEAEYLPDE